MRSKSQIAIEYCYQYRKKNPRGFVFWVYSSSIERFNQAYKEIARKLDLPGWNDPKINTLQIVSDWLIDGAHRNWLMILDNADDEDVFFSLQKGDSSEKAHSNQEIVPLSQYIPQTQRGSILVTSRNKKMAFSLTNRAECIVDVPPMGMGAAIALLHKKLPNDQSSDKDKEDLVETLEHLPLAITQAAAYISVRNTTMTVSKYLASFRQNKPILMEDMKDLRRDLSVPNSVIITWQLSFDQIKKTSPKAAELLSLISMLDRQGIPEFLFSSDDDSWEFENAIGVLSDFSLIVTETGGESFGLHRLVQIATRKWLDVHDETEKWKRKAIKLVSRSFPFPEYENWKQCRALLPHADAVLGYQYLDQESALRQADIFYNIAMYSWDQADFNVAYTKNQSALSIYREFLDEESVAVLNCLLFHAMLISYQGKYNDAEKLERKVPNIRQEKWGVDHFDTVSCQNNLAGLLFRQKKYDQAEEMQRAVLRTRKKILGLRHPDILDSMNNLALSLGELGKLDEAEKLHRAALIFKQNNLGSEHPDTLPGMHNLARLLGKSGKLDEAGKMYRVVLKLSQNSLGLKHPATLQRMHNLALTLNKQEKYDEAEDLYRRTLNLREAVLGKTHPDTLSAMESLGLALEFQDKLDEAEEIHQEIRKREAGKDTASEDADGDVNPGAGERSNKSAQSDENGQSDEGAQSDKDEEPDSFVEELVAELYRESGITPSEAEANLLEELSRQMTESDKES